MAKVKFFKINNSVLSSLPKVEGQLIFVQDTGEMYIDKDSSNRVQIKGKSVIAGTGISVGSDGLTVTNAGVRSISTGSSSGTISVNTNGTSANVKVKNINNAAYKDVDTSISSGSTSEKLPTTAAVASYVDAAIEAMPEPMIFKGSLGTGGTITSLPTASASNEGYTYKVITAGTYASQAAKVGDTFICAKTGTSTYEWILIPSGDEPSGTVTSVTIKATSPIAIDSSSAITTSGTRTLSHVDSGATAGSYGDSAAQTPAYGGTFKVPYVTVDAKGHVTSISDHTVKIPASDNTDTKNTAGSTDTNSKIFLVGATSQAANPQTYSHDTVYAGTDGHVYSNGKQTVNLSDTQALTNKTYNGYTLAAACAKAVVTTVDTSASLPTSGAVKTFVEGKGYVTTDTKNTAGSTDTSSKIYLIGATSQAANPQTYSDNEVYATSGVLTTKSVQVGGTAATMQYNSTDKCIEFVFA